MCSTLTAGCRTTVLAARSVGCQTRRPAPDGLLRRKCRTRQPDSETTSATSPSRSRRTTAQRMRRRSCASATCSRLPCSATTCSAPRSRCSRRATSQRTRNHTRTPRPRKSSTRPATWRPRTTSTLPRTSSSSCTGGPLSSLAPTKPCSSATR